MLPHHLTYFEKYYQNKPKFKGGYSWNNLPSTMKNRAYILNPDKFRSIGNHYKNLFLSHNFKENDKVILDYFLKKCISKSEWHECETKEICLKLDDPLRFRISRIKERFFYC